MTVTDGVRVHRYPVHPKLGRHQRLDGRSLAFVHKFIEGAALKPTHHEPAVPVLDQSDLIAQGIDVSLLVPGAARVDALGSCTGNAATAAVSRVLPADRAKTVGLDYTNPVAAERWAIDQYVRATAVDDCPGGMPSEDTGSSGLANAQVLKRRGLIGGYRHALTAHGLASLLQHDGAMLGLPWFNAFFEPDAHGFIDTTGWERSGVAGGHEVYATGVETVVQDHAGRLVLDRTVLTVRNSWAKAWGDNGNFRVRLSTLYGPVLRHAVDAIQIHA